ncbi:hypothetical protein [Flavobacterium hungaricum]|uniref:DUF4140 domain-containing protein n=1 Tax=Flavobacterium hungaricum TaxID=2082725 RepID=A0ABR9TE71_9FLAO|nr:hypothetical protein [Flavobacterium hungaricum]MBE8723635.1 hypothetical protein [Flavobacterium hungaricum]
MKIKKAVIVVLLVFTAFAGFAQGGKKLDKIIKRDYQIIEGTISKMSDKTVEYSLPGETIQISLDVSQIARIEFASGRSQTFDVSQNNTPTASNQSITAVEVKANTIAVLPIPYVNSQNLESSDEMSRLAQNDMYNRLLDKSANIAPLTVQDLRITNSLLSKAGITSQNIDQTPIEDLEKILGVDNIVAAKISFTVSESSTATTYSSGTKTDDKNKKVKTNDVSTTTANSQLYYYYTVYFDMYRNTTKIYSQTRKPFLNLKDSWMDSVTYLLKRSPIYVKK